MRLLAKGKAWLSPVAACAIALATMRSAGAAPLQSSLTPSGKQPFTVYKMPNGLDVVAMETHKVPLVTIVITAKAGAMTETPDINGLTHLWEHMFFKGNRRVPNQEAFNALVRRLGIDYNGDTAEEKVRYFFTMPSAFLAGGLQFMADAIQAPLLDKQELERERVVVLNEWDRDASQPSFDLARVERELIYGKQAYLRDALGARENVERATREQLLRIKDQVFVPSNCALLIAGDFNPKELKALVTKDFGGWKDPNGWKPVTHAPFPPFPKTTSFVMTRPNVQNADIEITFAGPRARYQPQDSYAADVLDTLLAQRSGRFFSKFTDSGLTFGAGMSYYTESDAGELNLSAQTKPQDATKVQAALLAEINAWAKPGYFTQAQLDDVRQRLIIDRKFELNQPSTYIKNLAFWWAITGLNYYDSYIANMRKVSLSDIQAFVNKYLVSKPYVAAILLSPEDAKAAGLKDTSATLAHEKDTHAPL